MILFKLIFLLLTLETYYAESKENEIVQLPFELKSDLINAGNNFEESSNRFSNGANIPILYYNKGDDLSEYQNNKQPLLQIAPRGFFNFQDIINSLLKWFVPDVPSVVETISLVELVFTVSINVIWIFIHALTGNPLVTIYNIVNIIVAVYRYLFVSVS